MTALWKNRGTILGLPQNGILFSSLYFVVKSVRVNKVTSKDNNERCQSPRGNARRWVRKLSEERAAEVLFAYLYNLSNECPFPSTFAFKEYST